MSKCGRVTTDLSKEEARKLALMRRRAIPDDERTAADRAIYDRLLKLIGGEGALSYVLIYVSLPGEVDTRRFIEDALGGHTDTPCARPRIAVPRVSLPDTPDLSRGDSASPESAPPDRAIPAPPNLTTLNPAEDNPAPAGPMMRFYEIRSLTDLTPGYRGIAEPRGYCPLYEPADDPGPVIVMPGLAFTRDGRRLGYGGGYYDRYLREHSGLYKIALCYSAQILGGWREDPHDVRPDVIITEREIIYIK